MSYEAVNYINLLMVISLFSVKAEKRKDREGWDQKTGAAENIKAWSCFSLFSPRKPEERSTQVKLHRRNRWSWFVIETWNLIPFFRLFCGEITLLVPNLFPSQICFKKCWSDFSLFSNKTDGCAKKTICEVSVDMWGERGSNHHW